MISYLTVFIRLVDSLPWRFHLSCAFYFFVLIISKNCCEQTLKQLYLSSDVAFFISSFFYTKMKWSPASILVSDSFRNVFQTVYSCSKLNSTSSIEWCIFSSKIQSYFFVSIHGASCDITISVNDFEKQVAPLVRARRVELGTGVDRLEHVP